MGTENIQKVSQTVFPTVDAITRNHIDLLLDIITTLRPLLTSDGQQGGPLDGGSASAASATFIKATSRLDAIIDDSDRWAIKAANDVLAEMVKTHARQQEFLTEQAISAKEVRRPSFQLRPVLAIKDGVYYAIWGDVGTSSSVVGAGDTPDAALRDFDSAFTRKADEQIRLEAEEPIPETPLTVKPRRKK